MLVGLVGIAAFLVVTAAALSILIPLAKKRGLQKDLKERAALAVQLSDSLQKLASVEGLAYREEHRWIDFERAEIGHAHAENLIRELSSGINARISELGQGIGHLIDTGHVKGDPNRPETLRPSDEGLTAVDSEYRQAVVGHLREYGELHRILTNPRLHLASALTEPGLRERAERERALAEPVPTHEEFHDAALRGINSKLPDLLLVARNGMSGDHSAEMLRVGRSAFQLPSRSGRPRSAQSPTSRNNVPSPVRKGSRRS